LVRLHKQSAAHWEVNYCGIMEDLPDGSQKENKIIPSEEVE
jgi:hypothetical protein